MVAFPTRLDHLIRVFRAHTPTAHGCSCGHPGEYATHLAYKADTIATNLAITAAHAAT